MVKNDFTSLLSAILEVKLDFHRINDVSLNEEIYELGFQEYKNRKGEQVVAPCLVNSKKIEYSLSVKQLAGLRIATGPLTAKWFSDFKEDANGTFLLHQVKELEAAGKDLKSLRFKVCAQLRIKNAQVAVADVPVYQDFCYEGSAAYIKGVRDLLKVKGPDAPGYYADLAEIRDALHVTKLLDKYKDDKYIVLLPVFTVL